MSWKLPFFYFQVEAKNPLHIFAYRAHAHSYGSVISGYMYNEAQRTWSLVAKGNPRWPQAFYPVKVIRGVHRNLSCGGGAEPQEPHTLDTTCISKNHANAIIHFNLKNNNHNEYFVLLWNCWKGTMFMMFLLTTILYISCWRSNNDHNGNFFYCHDWYSLGIIVIDKKVYIFRNKSSILERFWLLGAHITRQGIIKMLR